MNEDLDFDLLKKIKDYNQQRGFAFKNGLVFDYDKDIERILCARYMKVSRVKKRLVYLFARYNYIWFCTFTFDNNFINKCERTKRDLVKKSLTNFDFKYILNVDYGSKTERQHFHCIVATNYSFNLNDHLVATYPCFSNAKLVSFSDKDIKCVSSYINKLTNHSIKKSTHKQRIVYNFSGYRGLFPTSQEQKIAFLKDYVGLLDKANINGKNIE